MNIYPSTHPMPDFTPDYFSAHQTDDPAKEPIAVGESIPGIIATAANKLGRDRKEFSVERITAEQFQTLAQFLSS